MSILYKKLQNLSIYTILEDYLKIPCFDLINSVSEMLTQKNIGVLATSTTIKSAYYKKIIESKNKGFKVFQQECPEFVSEIERTKLNFKKINQLADSYLNHLLKENIEEIILGCSHYPLILNILKKKVDSKISFIDPSISLINKFNNYFLNLKNFCCDSISYDNVEFFVTSKSDEFAIKVKYWLEINKEIRLVNLRSND